MRNYSLLLIALLVFNDTNILGQATPNPRYKVVKSNKDEMAAVNVLADDGYRVVVSGPQIIMRLEAAPPDTFRYIGTNFAGGPVQSLNWVNEQGARGYRWVPGVFLMEKEPHPKNYEYSSSPGWSGRAEAKSGALISQGYRPVEEVSFASALGRGPTAVFFERELQTEPNTVSTDETWEVRHLDANRADTIVKKMNELGQNGYRYLGLYAPSITGGLQVSMRSCTPKCDGGPFEYRNFDAHNPSQLATDLNDLAKDGFRVIPESLRFRPHVLERVSGTRKAFAYHALLAKDAEALEKALNAPEEDGYSPIGYVWNIGFKSAEAFLVLEKALNASAIP